MRLVGQVLDHDLPLAVAPFYTANSTYQATRMTLYLVNKTGAAVSIDTWIGRFSLYYDDMGADFWPWEFDSAERSDLLGCFPTQFADRIESAVREVWREMVTALAVLVEQNKLAVVALVESPLAEEYSELSAGRWRNFRVDDWELGRAICPQTGELLFDVHFRSNAAPKIGSIEPSPPISANEIIRDSEKIRQEIEAWKLSNPEGRPTGAECLQHIIQERLGAKITREPFRKAYIRCFPEQRNARGRPRKTK